MKNLAKNWRSKAGGEGLVVIIILLAVVGGIAWWLFNTKKTADREGRAFGREMIQRLAVQHDQRFMAENFGPQAKLDNPPTKQAFIMGKLNEFGAPAQPIPIEERMTFESQFFAPKGYFTAKLQYPGQLVTMQIAISHPVGKWQLDNIDMVWQAPR